MTSKRFGAALILFSLACGGAQSTGPSGAHSAARDVDDNGAKPGAKAGTISDGERSASNAARAADEDPPSDAGDQPPMESDRTHKASDKTVDVLSDAGKQAAGAYITGPYVKIFGAKGVIRTLKRARLNAAVIDLKDGQGRVGYQTSVEILKPQIKPFLRDPKAIIDELRAAGIYTIARITCFADPLLPKAHPERAILHFRRDKPWVSWGTGTTWLDPYNRDNHKMIAELAVEAESFGFDEVQLDYVRFPVDDGTKYARYPGQDETTRPELIIELLKRVDTAISIPLGVDVFGLTAYQKGDPSGLGQDLEKWVDHVEVFSPMLYLNAMRTWRLDDPLRARHLIEEGVRELRGRIGEKNVIRPFIQGFEKGAGPTGYGRKFIVDQVRGAKAGGADGFLFWHPGANYGMVQRGLGHASKDLFPFPLRTDSESEPGHAQKSD